MPFSAQPQFMPTPRHAVVPGTAWQITPATVGPYSAHGRPAEVLSVQRQWPQGAAASTPGTGNRYLGKDGLPAPPAAQEWGHRKQGMQYDELQMQAGAAALQPGQPLRSTIPAAQHEQAHNPVQQQRGYTPQHNDMGPGASPCVARSPWEHAQPAAASGRAQQQTFSALPIPAQVQGYEQDMSPLLQAPHTHARQRPAPAMGMGHPRWPASGQPDMAVYGESTQVHPVAMIDTGYSSLGTGGDQRTAAYGRSVPAQQQQPMRHHAVPMQEGQVQESTAAWGPTPVGTPSAHPPLAANSAPLPQQQPWQYQQMSRPGFAPEQH